MKVIIFGATGSVGRLFVEDALAHGHDVTAFARNPDSLEIAHAALRRVAGDAFDPQAVSDAVKGHDAVVITLGSGMKRSGNVRSAGTANIINAMQDAGVKRLVCQSTLGTFESRANLNFFWKRIMFGLLLKPVYLDHHLQEHMVRASGLDWTIVRPGAFVDGPATGDFREGFGADERRLKLKIPRADVAAFLRRQLSENRYLRRAVAVSH